MAAINKKDQQTGKKNEELKGNRSRSTCHGKGKQPHSGRWVWGVRRGSEGNKQPQLPRQLPGVQIGQAETQRPGRKRNGARRWRRAAAGRSVARCQTLGRRRPGSTHARAATTQAAPARAARGKDGPPSRPPLANLRLGPNTGNWSLHRERVGGGASALAIGPAQSLKKSARI